MIFQETKSTFVKRTIIDSIFQRVSITILGLPLQGSSTALEKAAWLDLGHRAKQRRIQPGCFDIRIGRNLNLLLQRDARREYRYSQNLRRHVARLIGEAHVFQYRFTCANSRVRSQQHAPLNESRARTYDLRTFSFSV